MRYLPRGFYSARVLLGLALIAAKFQFYNSLFSSKVFLGSENKVLFFISISCHRFERKRKEQHNWQAKQTQMVPPPWFIENSNLNPTLVVKI